MKTYYFVVYETRSRADGSAKRANAIIEDIHPLIWATRPIEPYDSHFITIVLWWSEVPGDVANHEQVVRYIS